MNGNRRWFGWIAIGLGVIALFVALNNFGSQGGQGFGGSNAPQAWAQQGPGRQANQGFPDVNAQPGGQQNAGPQGNQSVPGANAQPGSSQQNTAPQNGQAPGARGQQDGGRQRGGPQNNQGQGGAARRGAGQSRSGWFGWLGWLGFPFRLIGSWFQLGVVALLVLLGVWFLRGRNTTPAAPARPAQGTPSPTGEIYIEEPEQND